MAQYQSGTEAKVGDYITGLDLSGEQYIGQITGIHQGECTVCRIVTTQAMSYDIVTVNKLERVSVPTLTTQEVLF